MTSAEKPGESTATLEQLLEAGWQIAHDENHRYLYNPEWVHRYPIAWRFAVEGDLYDATIISYHEYTP